MNSLPSHCSVLIVGAGPSGLMMAAQLLRFGIQPVIIDVKTGLTNSSRALAVQARSLEIMRQLGVDAAALEEGNVVKGLAIHEDTEEVAHLDLTSVGEGMSPFPYVLILEQSKTEKILLDYLTSNTCPVYWDTELKGVSSTEHSVAVRLRRGDIDETLTCDWLIGADGASSSVRKSQGTAFAGGTYMNRFYLADINLKGQPDGDDVRVFLEDKGFTGIFPMQRNNYRFIGILPRTLRNRESVTFDDIRPYITYASGIALEEESCYWFSTYQLHHRVAERFRNRRCFLIGDAAHIHSPAGGQGMNTGLQDAYNLAWKLSGVLNKEYHERILDTYAAERMPVARALLKTTDRLFTIAATQNWLISKIRNWLLPKVLQKLWKDKSIPGKLFARISQTGIQYRSSSLSVHHSQAGQVRAGDRLPYLRLFDEKLKEDTDLHSWCSKPGFTLLVIGFLSQRDVHLLAKWIKSTYPSQLNFYYLPPSKANQHIFDFFEIKEDKKKALMIRPDMHIGYVNDIVDIELLDVYLKETVGWRK
ncbi:FAD-dependent monooxygenase [Arcticibacter tournemirensis]